MGESQGPRIANVKLFLLLFHQISQILKAYEEEPE